MNYLFFRKIFLKFLNLSYIEIILLSTGNSNTINEKQDQGM